MRLTMCGEPRRFRPLLLSSMVLTVVVLSIIGCNGRRATVTGDGGSDLAEADAVPEQVICYVAARCEISLPFANCEGGTMLWDGHRGPLTMQQSKGPNGTTILGVTFLAVDVGEYEVVINCPAGEAAFALAVRQ